MIAKRLQKIDRFLNFISIDLEFSRVNPTNVRSAMIKFKKSKKNPIFEYEEPDEYLAVMRSVRREISFGDSQIEKLLERKRKDLIRKIRFLNSIGTESFTKRSCQIYRPPNKRLIELAYSILKLPKSKKQKKIYRKEARAMIRFAFKMLGFRWRIRNSDIITSARVNPLKQTLELRKKERFSEKYVRRLIVHELGTHAVRAENARQQPLLIFLHGLPGYLETEEGLAAYAEHLTGVLDNSTLRNYAGRVIAIHYALEHDFRSTYNHLRKYFSDKMAWKLTLRAKRGLSDTSQPGAYTKDVIYLRGFLNVKRYIEKGGDLEELYIGKIGLKDIPLIRSISEIKKPEYLPFRLFANEMITREVPLPADRKEQLIKSTYGV